MAGQRITRKRMLLQMAGKYVAIALLFGGLYSPSSAGMISKISTDLQESLISFMGFLMAAAIIGAFELSYLRTNLDAVIWLCKAALPHLAPGSCIINTTSIQAYDPSPSLLDYAATKAALNNLTVNLAASLGPRGIRVNAVAPGPIWTPLQPATRESEKVETFGSDTPLGRAGQPGEVAPAYVFLASPTDASYVSGTVIGVTGGGAVF